MNNLKRLTRMIWNLPAKAKIFVASVVICFLVFVVYFLVVTFESLGDYVFDRNIQKLEKASDLKIKEADFHEDKAGEWKDKRIRKEAEYKSRQPIRERLDREAESSKRTLEQARKEYEKALTSNPDSDTDIDERERRAITNARELYDRN